MEVTLSDMVIFVNPEQPENAAKPRRVTLLGMVIFVNPELPVNALFPMV